MLIHYSFKVFVALMRFVGVLTYEIHGRERLAASGELVIATSMRLPCCCSTAAISIRVTGVDDGPAAIAFTDGRLIGVGFACYSEQTGHGCGEWVSRGSPFIPGYESCTASLLPDGTLDRPGLGRIVFGEMDGTISGRGAAFADACRRAARCQ